MARVAARARMANVEIEDGDGEERWARVASAGKNRNLGKRLQVGM